MDFLGRSQQFSEIVVFVKKDLTNKKGFCLFRTSDNRECHKILKRYRTAVFYSRPVLKHK